MAERMLLAFGRYLKLVRERRKLSLEDVATLTKSYPEPINKGYLSRVERGLARVGFSKMVALARAYDMPLDAFGEKLALDLEVDHMKDAPNTKEKTFGELTAEAIEFSRRGLRWHFYACLRDALPRAAVDDLWASYRNQHEQRITAALSHGVSARGLGRHALALAEFEFVAQNIDALGRENASIVFQQMSVVKRHLGALDEARTLADKAVALAEQSPRRTHLGDALESQGHLAGVSGNHEGAVEVFKETFAAYKAAGRRVDCARTLNNLAQNYFALHRLRAASRALHAAERLAVELGSETIRARSKLLLGELAILGGDQTRATALWHEAADIARRSHDTVVIFKAEFQLFKLAITLKNSTVLNAIGRRLNRMVPWMSRDEPELAQFRQLYTLHRKPKQRSVARQQHNDPVSGNPV